MQILHECSCRFQEITWKPQRKPYKYNCINSLWNMNAGRFPSPSPFLLHFFPPATFKIPSIQVTSLKFRNGQSLIKRLHEQTSVDNKGWWYLFLQIHSKKSMFPLQPSIAAACLGQLPDLLSICRQECHCTASFLSKSFSTTGSTVLVPALSSPHCSSGEILLLMVLHGQFCWWSAMTPGLRAF